jgi:type II pantothenate kinase
MVASSFGKLVMKENPREGVKEEDLALALLMMITNNIGQVAHLNAQLHHCSKIFFVGSFLRHNPISARRLAFAIDFWSSGSMEALFLVHEGYFGALGTFLQSAFGDDVDGILSSKDYCGEQVGPSAQPSTQQSPDKPSPRAGSSSSLSSLQQEKGEESDTPDSSNRSPLGKYITSQFAKWRNKSFSNRPSAAELTLSTDSNDQGDDSPALAYPRKNRSSSDDFAVRSPRNATSSVGGSGKNHGRSSKL